jgi:hypothetical protein
MDTDAHLMDDMTFWNYMCVFTQMIFIWHTTHTHTHTHTLDFPQVSTVPSTWHTTKKFGELTIYYKYSVLWCTGSSSNFTIEKNPKGYQQKLLIIVPVSF